MNRAPMDRSRADSSRCVFPVRTRIKGADDAAAVWSELRSRGVSAAADSEGVTGSGDPVESRAVGSHDEDCAMPLGHEQTSTVW